MGIVGFDSGADYFAPRIPSHADYHRMEREAAETEAIIAETEPKARAWLLEHLPPPYERQSGRFIRAKDIHADLDGAEMICYVTEEGAWKVNLKAKHYYWSMSLFDPNDWGERLTWAMDLFGTGDAKKKDIEDKVKRGDQDRCKRHPRGAESDYDARYWDNQVEMARRRRLAGLYP